MSGIDALIIVAFVVYSIYSGFSSKKQASRNLEEYFLAGRKLPGWQVGLSMAATQFAADTPLLVTGLIATAGIFALWQLWIYAFAFLLMGFVLAPQWRRASVLTDAEFTEIRYGSGASLFLRTVKAIYFGTIFNCVVLGWVLFAAAKIAEPFLPWELWLPAPVFETFQAVVEWVGVPVTNLPPGDPLVWTKTTSNMISLLLIVVVTTLYSTTGGLRSVVKTDVAQMVLMLVGTFLYSYMAVKSAGGLDVIHQKVVENFPEGARDIQWRQILAFTPDAAKNASMSVLALFGLQWLIQLNSDGTGYLAQRAMACRSDFDSKVAGVVFTVTQVLLRSLLWIPLGLALLVLFPFDASLGPEAQVAARESTYVIGMSKLLPIGARGIVVTAMLAALASTLDTHLNWGASYWTNDLYKRLICDAWLKRKPSERSLVLVARLSNLAILTLALIVMSRLRSIQEAWQISLLLGAGMGPTLLLRWFWWRINSWSEIFAIIVSALLAPILYVFVEDQAVRLLLIAAGSLSVSTAAAFVFKQDKSHLQTFYDRVRPIGFWAPMARAGHRTRKKLVRGLIAVLIAGFSLYCLLVGFGSWLAYSPAPQPFSDEGWIALNIVVGLSLIPIWWRLGVAESQ